MPQLYELNKRKDELMFIDLDFSPYNLDGIALTDLKGNEYYLDLEIERQLNGKKKSIQWVNSVLKEIIEGKTLITYGDTDNLLWKECKLYQPKEIINLHDLFTKDGIDFTPIKLRHLAELTGNKFDNDCIGDALKVKEVFNRLISIEDYPTKLYNFYFLQKVNQLIRKDTSKTLGIHLYHKKKKIDGIYHTDISDLLIELKELEDSSGLNVMDFNLHQINYDLVRGFRLNYLSNTFN